jgi:hypothetical protein
MWVIAGPFDGKKPEVDAKKNPEVYNAAFQFKSTRLEFCPFTPSRMLILHKKINF